MSNRSARATLFAFIALPACNGQFDFDVYGRDADSEWPVIVIDAVPDDASTDAPIEASRPVVHIACGSETSCEVSGCCSTSAGPTCVDIADGGSCSGLLIQCDDSDDCPEGQVCCAEGAENGDPLECGDAACPTNDPPARVHCEPEAHCRSLNYVILCNPNRPSPCTQCTASTLEGLPSGYHQCAATP